MCCLDVADYRSYEVRFLQGVVVFFWRGVILTIQFIILLLNLQLLILTRSIVFPLDANQSFYVSHSCHFVQQVVHSMIQHAASIDKGHIMTGVLDSLGDPNP
jgi:hypothetical protein